MPQLPDQPSSEEAREAAGLTKLQWDNFLLLTREYVKKLRKHEPNLTWRGISNDKRSQIFQDINTELQRQKLPTIDKDEVLALRMSQALSKLRTEGMRIHSPPCITGTDDVSDKKKAQVTANITPYSVDTTSTANQPPRKLPYDPTRHT
ncbi:hypothetical protein Alg130_10277 [Pyrenophora tritici-repentis]|uniref:Uncharacterized protein n=1 Tax=Pyrenophora tritici-repentis TaxID=45151 RepID=A0A2W1DIQ9_9PLEO|nr:hypothetical protein A1F99_044600 [Pyrenophora tritici-repentis]KAI0569941.1 hypothetical protein Alg215_11355 [Pyrenophora tritici-repentis]KAI0572991.1 hypothetical protein Alg130_10277 [Pyrenophora tritici-repentis]KAI1508864.1 hypothetical protein Ptr86124_012163 [Pyrenophora tritici-repentis]KAI1523674.1 hypothetical protein PtrSN001C_011351 [Pyrenophora tritici-repentis]